MIIFGYNRRITENYGMKTVFSPIWRTKIYLILIPLTLFLRVIGVRFNSLVYGNYQINLFEDTQEQINLYQALDKINTKFGDKTVCRAVGMSVGRRRFNPFNGTTV